MLGKFSLDLIIVKIIPGFISILLFNLIVTIGVVDSLDEAVLLIDEISVILDKFSESWLFFLLICISFILGSFYYILGSSASIILNLFILKNKDFKEVFVLRGNKFLSDRVVEKLKNKAGLTKKERDLLNTDLNNENIKSRELEYLHSLSKDLFNKLLYSPAGFAESVKECRQMIGFILSLNTVFFLFFSLSIVSFLIKHNIYIFSICSLLFGATIICAMVYEIYIKKFVTALVNEYLNY